MLVRTYRSPRGDNPLIGTLHLADGVAVVAHTIDDPLLRALADPGGFHRAADASALEGSYEGLAGNQPCPGGVVLGR